MNNKQLNFGHQLHVTKAQIENAIGGHVDCLLELNNAADDRVWVHLLKEESLVNDSRYRFIHESEQLTETRCPEFAAPWSFGVEHGYAFVISKAESGKRLSELAGPVSPLEALSITIDVVNALSTIHDLGISFRRVVAANVFVENGRGILAGCDASRFISPAELKPESAIDFAAFASPELAGAIDHDIGATSDIYSVGVLLFRLLSGCLPFDAESPGEILFRHLTNEAPWELLPPNTPVALRRILAVMLQKEPLNRYQTAASLLFDLASTHELMLAGQPTENLVIRSKDIKAAVCDPAFVGRRQELQSLAQTLSSSSDGQTKNVLVACPSGIGKSRLILEFLRYATKKNINVLRSKGSNEASREPMGPLREVIDQLADIAAGNALLRQDLASQIGTWGSDLTTICPDFIRQIRPDLVSGKTGPDEFGQNLVENAVANLLTVVASSKFPFIIWIDDCQWLDEQTLKILGLIAESKSKDLLLLSSMRSENLERVQEFVAKVRPKTSIELGPLSEDEVQLLQESMTGPLPEEAAQTIVRLAAGSPFMASAVTRGMFETGAIKRGNDVWKIDQEKLSNIQAADDAAQVLLQRLRSLPQETLLFLSIAAIAGKEFDIQSVFEVSRLTDLPKHIQSARNKRLIWSKPSGAFSFAHDKIRESLIANLEPSEIEQIHLQYARFLESNRPHKTFDLAFHFHRATQYANAFPFAMKSAEKARKQFSLPVAKDQLAIAGDGISSADHRTKYYFYLLASDVYMLDGNYDVSQELLEQAKQNSSSPSEKAQIVLQTGELEFKRGNKKAAVKNFEQALADLGHQSPRFIIPAVAKEVAAQTLHTLFPKYFVDNDTYPSPNQQMACKLYSRLAHGYWYTRDKYFTLWSHLRGMNLAEKFAATPELAQTYSEHAPVMSLIPWHSRGLDYADRSLEIRKESGDTWGLGQSRNFKSILHYSASEFEACIEQARQAVTVLERTGDYWEIHIARYQLAAAMYRKGDLEGAAREAQQTYYSALELGDFQSTSNIIDVWIRSNLNWLPADVLERELARPENDLQAKCQVLLAEGVSLIGKGEYDDASKCFADAIERSEKAGVCIPTFRRTTHGTLPLYD